jgi:cytochrome c-type biogenesis protein CcmH
MFWILALILAFAAALILTLPLLRSGSGDQPVPEGAHDVEVYRDQLAELARDAAGGLISPSDADYARAEIGRRLLAASDTLAASGARDSENQRRRTPLVFAIILLLVVPVTGVAFYSRIGHPELPDQPLAARLANPGSDINIMIARVEAQLAANPDDGAGWEVIAPVYLSNRRPADAANAWKNAIRVLGATPARLGNMAEALVVAASGEVTLEAAKVFAEVLTLDPKDARARFYLANRLEQTGSLAEAEAGFKALMADSPKDAPWAGIVNDHLAFIRRELASATPGAVAPGNPDEADFKAAEGMSAADRQQMISTMVEGLDARLTADPDNFEGWMRLVRSYMVLGEPDKAKDALARGLRAFPASGAEGKALLEAAKGLGISTEGLSE